MKYELNRLGPDNFELLIQSLVRGIAGIPTIVFGDGPDGQREAVVENAVFKINDAITVSGHTVVQAKYKSPDGKEKDWDWLRSNLKNELDKFEEKTKTHPQIVPNTYLFFTNIVLTPVLDTGIRDKAEAFINEYKNIIPNIHILGTDDIRTLLENNRDVAKCYSSFIMPGDVLAETIDMLNSIKNQKFENLVEYAHLMFREDCSVRLEQAGSVDNKLINIRNVYTDLEARAINIPNKKVRKIASYIIGLGNGIHIRTSEHYVHKHERLPLDHNIVLIGNAGQGKSTLCQYICQIYRAALIKRFRSGVIDAQGYFTDELGEAAIIPTCERFPILINLKRYAAWVNKQENENNISVLSYILWLVNSKTGGTLSIYELRMFFSGFSWIFVFDGLDEVPASANRSEVLKQIQEFLNKDLVETKCDSLVICTSRPQGYDNAFDERKYSHYHLENMSKPLCKKYVERLLLNLEDNADIREQYSNTLSKALDDQMVSKLMTTPLYAAIVVLLVKMGGTPPSKRYDLFDEYCRIVINREQQKEMLPPINDDFGWIKDLHSQIGFLLQIESETRENTAAELSSSRLKKIIEQYLIDAGIIDDLKKETDQIYQAITKRLTFISEVNGEDHEDSIVFPLRSIQEYFAAEWIITFDDEDKLSEALEIISVSSYWRNVFLFVAGYFTKHLNRKNINETLFRICQRNNGDVNFANPDAEETLLWQIGQHGSRLALELLCENLFTRPSDIQRYLNLATELINDRNFDVHRLTQNFLRLPARISEKFLHEKIIPHIKEKMDPNSVSFCYLWAKANDGNEYALEQLDSLIDIIEAPESGSIRMLLSYGFSKLSKTVIKKVFEWITEIYFSDFCSPWWAENTYWQFMSYYYQVFPEEGLSNSIVRQIVYLTFMERVKKQDRGSIEFVARRDSSLNELLLEENDLLPRYDMLYGENGLKAKVMNFELEKYLFVKYREFFKVNQFDELVSLIEYVESPSNKTLRQLVLVCNELPHDYLNVFLRIMKSCHWTLMEVGEWMDETDDIETLIKRYDDLYESSCKNDEELISLVRKGDICAITHGDFWDHVDCGYIVSFPECDVLDCLRIASKKTFSDGFINFICTTTRVWCEFPDELKNFCVENFSTMFQRMDGVELALKLFDALQPCELIATMLQYPQNAPDFWIPTAGEDEQAQRILDKISRIADLGGDFLNVYALIPHLSGRLIVGIAKEQTDEIKKRFVVIKEAGNPMALLGFIFCVLCDELTTEIEEIIEEDFIKILQNKNAYLNWFATADSFSTSGKIYIYKTLISIANGEPRIIHLVNRYSEVIQAETEAKSIDKSTLVGLATSAHGY